MHARTCACVCARARARVCVCGGGGCWVVCSEAMYCMCIQQCYKYFVEYTSTVFSHKVLLSYLHIMLLMY